MNGCIGWLRYGVADGWIMRYGWMPSTDPAIKECKSKIELAVSLITRRLGFDF